MGNTSLCTRSDSGTSKADLTEIDTSPSFGTTSPPRIGTISSLTLPTTRDSDDYGSVMHYGAYAFSQNRKPTIQTKGGNYRIGQRNGVSDQDVLEIRKLYGC